ncbi:rubrerythrin [Acidaminobacter sp. JC074]|uniref:ferritin-like domain-containing protein n=1 Tax=Acidaminobacter sp. JC074 TaxID=2530199 RepID=UPI001F0D8820|nr:ferritin family protein [Acidaminobacter sp. JC074]MCH4888625.1 rubrerythrin [Acidaminobacter sp. JC074]
MMTLAYIKQAIISEIEGYEFYRMAAGQTRDVQMKETYLELAEEERKHVVWLQDLHKSIDSGSDFDLMTVDAPPSPEIFKWDKLDREDPKTILSVFGIALQLEKASFEFYKKASEEVEEKSAKELFKILEAWERAHYDVFNKEYNNLQEDWWSEQGFAPF